MNINRHNYEEFFLLYVDGELSATNRIAVEEFAGQNPDLAAELDMLMQTVLPTPSVLFGGKEDLLKLNTVIGSSNYQEYFLLAVDDELGAKEKNDVEKFVLQHPELQNAFTTLQSTRLPIETIAHPNKAELYRTERQRRLVPFSWVKMGAAAAIIILIAGVWTLQSKDVATGNSRQLAVVKKDKVLKPVKQEQQAATREKAVPEPAVDEQEVASSIPHKNSTSIAALDGERSSAKSNISNKIKPPAAAPRQQQKLLPPTPEMMAAVIAPGARSNTPITIHNKATLTTNGDVATLASKPIIDNEVAMATPAVYKQMDDDSGDEHLLLIGSAEINTQKLKSLLGKASSLFKRKANKADDDDDNTISIANFQIKSK